MDLSAQTLEYKILFKGVEVWEGFTEEEMMELNPER